MNKGSEYNFCMQQFKPAIVVLAVLLVAVLGWTAYHCTGGNLHHGFQAVAAQQPIGPPIGVNDKMVHPYWGNCNKCHVTVDAGAPVSQVMAGPPISVNDKMLHPYWGNCLLCHKVLDGFQAPAAGTANNGAAKAAGFTRVDSADLGMKLQTVTAAMMDQFGLANKDGVLVLSVVPGSSADAAGIMQGDEIVMVGGKRVEGVNDFETEINNAQPGSRIKLKIFRDKRSRNLYVVAPGSGSVKVVAAPMAQNQVDNFAERLWGHELQKGGGPRAFQQPAMAQAVAGVRQYFGKVAIASTGPGMGYGLSPSFGRSPFFVIYDPATGEFSVVANPNANDLTGVGTQTGQYMVDLGVSNVVAGSFSPEAAGALHTLRVNMFQGMAGSVQDALSVYNSGRLMSVGKDPGPVSLRQAGFNPGSPGLPDQNIY